jgi:hypothetical protein
MEWVVKLEARAAWGGAPPNRFYAPKVAFMLTHAVL